MRTKVKRFRALGTIAAGLLLAGCGLIAPRLTPAPIYVTATPAVELPTDSPTPENTAVVGPTLASTPTSALPTLSTSTATPPATQKPSLTPSFTLTYTDSPEPSQAGGVVKCPTAPQGGFAAIFAQDVALQKALGCPQGPAVAISSAVQAFDNGRMLWASQLGDVPTKVIYVLYNNGTYQRYVDTWVENVDPASTGEVAPPGRNTPVRGFGKVWHNNPAVKNTLGWATNTEAGTPGQIQRFERGEMLFVTALGQTFIFTGGMWRANATPF
jgi:hypothetical protein